MFISFEGIDGSGKSTQIDLLSEHLQSIGREYIKTREPGGTASGEEIRKIFKNYSLEPKSELLLLYASRLEQVDKVILPNRDKVVICDRFDDSTIAYQHYGRSLPLSIISKIRELTIGDFKPDITFLLDISDIEDRDSRIRDRSLDKIELESINFHQRVAEGYRQIYRENRDRIHLLDGSKSIEDISEEIKKIVEEKL